MVFSYPNENYFILNNYKKRIKIYKISESGLPFVVSMLYTAIQDNHSLIISVNCIISVFTRIYTHTVAHTHTHTLTHVRVKRYLRAFPRLSCRDISAIGFRNQSSKFAFVLFLSLSLSALVNNCHRCCVRIEMGLEARGIA